MTDPVEGQELGDTVKPPLFGVLGTPAVPTSPVSPEPSRSPFDELMITPEEAAKRPQLPTSPQANEPEQELEVEDSPILAEEVEKICKAMDRLARKGLNMKAVIALLHDSNPTIPKKMIKTILESLRELPAIYGRDLRSRDPLKNS